MIPLEGPFFSEGKEEWTKGREEGAGGREGRDLEKREG